MEATQGPSTGELINNTCYFHIMGNYSAIKKWTNKMSISLDKS